MDMSSVTDAGSTNNPTAVQESPAASSAATASEDMCPICCEEMHNDQNLTSCSTCNQKMCSAPCAVQLHAHSQARNQPVNCPVCRVGQLARPIQVMLQNHYHGAPPVALDLHPDATVDEAKKAIQKKTGIPASDQTIIHNGRPLPATRKASETTTMRKLNIRRDSTLQLTAKTYGGSSTVNHA